MSRAKRPAGPPAAGEPAFLAAGLIRRPHGVAGEALVELYTDFPERLRPRKVVYVGEQHELLTIRRSRPHSDGLIVAFEGIRTPEEIGRYRNQVLYVNTTGRPKLLAGEYYHDELLGLRVVDDGGQTLGELTEILQTGANDVYVVRDARSHEVLLPATSEVILGVDLLRRTMEVHLLAGLLTEDEE